MTASPTQIAYDRIQQAGTRSPILVPCDLTEDKEAILVRHELCHQGVALRLTSQRLADGEFLSYNHVVSWSELAFAVEDPLKHAFEMCVRKMKEARREPVAVAS